jgi:type II secretory pathway component PulK
MKRPRRHRGFALLLVLVLVLLAGVALAGLARRSAVGALESRAAAEELQRRWAVTTCGATLLRRAEIILDEAERGEDRDGRPSEAYRNKPCAERHVACRLAGIDYELVLTDEQAKLNVNGLLAEIGRADAQSAVARLVGASHAPLDATVAVELRPLATVVKAPATASTHVAVNRPTGTAVASVAAPVPASVAAGKTGTMMKLGGYGQIFSNASPLRLIGEGGVPGLTRSVTCWGDGRVNFRRAPAEVIERACEKTLGREIAGALVAARERDPYGKLADVMPGLRGFTAARMAKIPDCVTDESTCHSLWVIARGPQRSWYALTVAVGGAGVKDAAEADGASATNSTASTGIATPTGTIAVTSRPAATGSTPVSGSAIAAMSATATGSSAGAGSAAAPYQSYVFVW